MTKIILASFFALLGFAAQSQPFMQVGASLADSNGALVQSVSVDAGYRLGAVDLAVGLAESKLTVGTYSKRYMSKTASAVGYLPLGGSVAALAGVQGSIDHADQFSWRYGVGLVVHVNGLTVSIVASPAQDGKASLVGMSIKKRF